MSPVLAICRSRYVACRRLRIEHIGRLVEGDRRLVDFYMSPKLATCRSRQVGFYMSRVLATCRSRHVDSVDEALCNPSKTEVARCGSRAKLFCYECQSF
jgi:hypothetical protein